MKFYDIHTHRICPENKKSIINVSPFEFEKAKAMCENCFFSCGIHPWDSENSETQMARLLEIAGDSCIVAIGEAGLDKMRGALLDSQLSVFKKQIELSENLKKPLVIHCVKAWNELINVRHEIKPTQPWIIHGYRGKPELTKQLVSEGFLFSAGSKINEQSVSLIPLTSLFCETDESEMDIREIYEQTATAIGVDIQELALTVTKNVRKVFPML